MNILELSNLLKNFQKALQARFYGEYCRSRSLKVGGLDWAKHCYIHDVWASLEYKNINPKRREGWN